MSDLREVMAREQMAVEDLSLADVLAELATLRTRVETVEREKQAAERRVEEMRKGLGSMREFVADELSVILRSYLPAPSIAEAEEIGHVKRLLSTLERLLSQPAAGRTDGERDTARIDALERHILAGQALGRKTEFNSMDPGKSLRTCLDEIAAIDAAIEPPSKGATPGDQK
jgi:hypothetical protein